MENEMFYLLLFAVITVNVEYVNGNTEVLECDTSNMINYYPDQKLITIDRCENIRSGDIIFKSSFE